MGGRGSAGFALDESNAAAYAYDMFGGCHSITTSVLLALTLVLVGCRSDSVPVPVAGNRISVDPHGMVQICVTNMPVPDLIEAIDRACARSKCGYSLRLRLTGNWEGQREVLQDDSDDPFDPNSKWTSVSKMPHITITEEHIFITNLLHSIESRVMFMGVSYLDDGRNILITALPFPE